MPGSGGTPWPNTSTVLWDTDKKENRYGICCIFKTAFCYAMAASKIAYLGMVSYFKAHIYSYMSIFHRGMKMLLTKMSEHAYFTVERIYFANELFIVLHR
jgi:hypothetical protein